MNALRKYVLYVWLAMATIMVIAVTTFARVGTEKFLYRSTYRAARIWAWGMLRITGTKLDIQGLERVPNHGPFVIMGNHRSHLDAAVLIYALPFLFGFIVKEELMKIPVFAGGMKAIGCVAVSRGRSRDDHAVLDQAAEEVAGGKNILVFPEGTRAPDEEFLPFKKGGVLLAIKAGVPILPFGLSGTGRIIPARVLSVNPGPVRVEFGDVITTEGRTIEERDALLEEVREAVVDLFIPDFADIKSGDPVK